VQVSWDRPYGKYCQIVDAPLSQGSGEFFLWEFPLAFWMEKQGYDVSYISNIDTHADGKGLLRAKGWLSIGHDEYWSLDMFHNVKAAVG
jgi:N,N-dimethylformamidase beta subunit-like protein